MSPAVLNKSYGKALSFNPINKAFGPKSSHFKNLNSFKTIKKVVEVTSDKETFFASKEFLNKMKEQSKKLPNLEFNEGNWEKLYSETNKNIQTLEEFLTYIGKWEINEPNAKKVVANLSLSCEILNHISDYLILGIKISKDKKEIEKSKKTYTLGELKGLLAA